MLPGFSGHLISESFLEDRLSNRHDDGVEAASRLRTWRARCAHLGPASSVRAVHETAAVPLVHNLGFVTIGSPVPLKRGLAVSMRAENEPVVLITSDWGEPLGPLWRTAIEHAARQHAAWCVLFNGTNIRIVDSRRLYTRRHADVDIDLALEQERTAEAMLTVFCARGVATLGELVSASDRHSTSMCVSLRSGVFEASSCISRAL